MSTLSPLADILASPPTPTSALSNTLSTLFEPSPILLTKLVPQLAALPHDSISLTITTYSALIDLVLTAISSWDALSKAEFIASHPRIGEINNLSHLS
ncbi:hypothetical protein M422DRAFT_147931, partial [Sphaerobolus stellatus SS14]